MIKKSAPTFAGRFGMLTAGADASNDRPEAEVWMNIGYETGDKEYPLVTLPFGIPVDTQTPMKNNSRNPKYAAFVDARNDLLEQIQKMASELAPGDETIIGGLEGGLVIQLRRRAGPAEAVPADENPFVRDIVTRPQTQAG